MSASSTLAREEHAEGDVIYHPEETVGIFRGYEQTIGKVGDCDGPFVLEHVGSWRTSTVTTTRRVVEGCGMGDRTGISGSGGYVAKHEIPETSVALEYELPV